MITVEIVRMADGARRVLEHSHVWDDGPNGTSRYLWGDGNYSCDCNRSMFFADAGGEEEPEELECGESAYRIRITANGIEVYRDDDFPSADYTT